jgi:hypothetical protein
MGTCNANAIKDEITGKIKVTNNFYLTLEGKFIKSNDKEYIFLYNKEMHLNIRICEIEYRKDYTKAEILHDMKDDLPKNTSFIYSSEGDIEYYGYYEYVITREDEYHSFVGEVFGDKAKLTIIFYFQDIQLLEKAKQIWMSCSAR